MVLLTMSEDWGLHNVYKMFLHLLWPSNLIVCARRDEVRIFNLRPPGALMGNFSVRLRIWWRRVLKCLVSSHCKYDFCYQVRFVSVPNLIKPICYTNLQAIGHRQQDPTKTILSMPK